MRRPNYSVRKFRNMDNKKKDGKKQKPSKASTQLAQARLSTLERKRLRKAETVIKRGFKSFLKVGLELKKIHDEKLYRQAHKTWAAYCRKRWGITRTHAERLIAAARLAKEELTPKGIGFRSEGQLRELTKLTPKQFTKVVKKARAVAREEEVPLTATLVVKQLTKHRGPEVETRHRRPVDVEIAFKFVRKVRPIVTYALKTLTPKVEALIKNVDDMDDDRLDDLIHEMDEFLRELKNATAK